MSQKAATKNLVPSEEGKSEGVQQESHSRKKGGCAQKVRPKEDPGFSNRGVPASEPGVEPG